MKKNITFVPRKDNKVNCILELNYLYYNGNKKIKDEIDKEFNKKWKRVKEKQVGTK